MERDATSNKEKEEWDALVKPVTVVLQNEVGREFFLSESPEYREELGKECEAVETE